VHGVLRLQKADHEPPLVGKPPAAHGQKIRLPVDRFAWYKRSED